jgi:hypothetical protein
VGDVIHARLIVLLVATGSMTPFGGTASRAEPEIWQAGKGIEMVVGSIARLKAAAQLCRYGRAERWDAIIEAIDKRYARCVAEDGRWSQLMRDADKKDCEAKPKDVSCGPGSVYVRADFDEDVRKARKIGVEAFCDSFPWKWVMESGPENAKAKEGYIKADPRSEVSMMLTLFDSVEAIGRQLDWVAAPCDKSFW